MADNQHNPHEQSLAFVQSAAKVSGFEFESNEHHTKNPSDLQDVQEAQIVTNNKDSYLPTDDVQLDLQSGPAKKYIDEKPVVPLSNFAAAHIQNQNQDQNQNQIPIQNEIQNEDQNENQNQIPIQNQNQNQIQSDNLGNSDNINLPNNDNEILDAFAPSSNQQEKQTYDAFFTADDNKVDDNSNNENLNNDQKDDDDDDEDEEDIEQKQTFLSVWQEQRREHLSKKTKEEREAQTKSSADGKKVLEEFNEKRRARIEQQRKEAKEKENDLKEDYNSVFKHGTVWQQVARLVDLQQKDERLERMKNLLIVLKNQDEQKSDN